MVQIAPEFTHTTTLPAPATPTHQDTPAEPRAAILARRRLLLVARFAALSRSIRPMRRVNPEVMPAPSGGRMSLLGGGTDAEPVLAPHERRRLQTEVAIARTLAEWDIGRASPCYWLMIVETVEVVEVSTTVASVEN